MNLDSLRDKLLAAARRDPPSDRVPYAFEKRILARLREQPVPDLGALWTRMLWRAAAPCVALTLTIGVWSFMGSLHDLEIAYGDLEPNSVLPGVPPAEPLSPSKDGTAGKMHGSTLWFMESNATSVPTESGEVVEFPPDFEQTMLAVVHEQAEEFW